MGKIWILGRSYLSLCLIFLVHVCVCDSQEQAFNTYTISSFAYSRTYLKPYDWRYIRVDLAPWFSSMSLALESDVDIDLNKVNNASASSLPIICLREGSLPLPDVYDPSLAGLGTWYFGLFNGIGPMRTRSKMINRGSAYSFSGNVSVEGCMTSLMLGPFCNQTVNMLSCNANNNLTGAGMDNEWYRRMEKNVIACRNVNGIVCHEDEEPKLYSVDVTGITEALFIAAANITFNQTQPSNITRSRGLMCYARHGSTPLEKTYDFSGDLSKAPLVINFPKAGRWFITIRPIDISNKSEEVQSNSSKVCYLLEWQVFQCPFDKAGLNCTMEKYMLQSRTSDDAWTFFLLDIPSGATGGNIHIRLTSSVKINYEIYARNGGLPSLSTWDYFYASSTNSSSGSMFFKLYDSSEKAVSFYMFYAKGGLWSFGLRKLDAASPTSQTVMSISLERCPQKCSSHGTCQSVLDTSGLTLYSYCACDRDHGGIDCSVELVSPHGHVRQSIFLIASNAAAVLPAFWSLRNKLKLSSSLGICRMVLFMSSGTASALYHACDVGTWCIMPFHVLQFLDFWLSFMAVVSTFVYLSSVSEASKRTIHTIVAILTAIMAENDPTRARNIAFVIGLGALGLLVGWLLEFLSHARSFSFSTELHLNLLNRWESVKGWTRNIIKTTIKRFHWGFLPAGLITLAMAAISWALESTETYWIWHSLWHIFIYTSSFFFLCSKAKVASCDNERPPDEGYELTRQTSFNRGEQRHER
ncbi:UNVERIFIED_CONTAM: hypothetical protein Scaly_2846600 [Sesamum calycinum]|uniref:EGF-like domain-containing protein n=1 Tax=Sesamum calycinum TaxID=2727403 RepID=A0AAW2IR36_9LAMI